MAKGVLIPLVLILACLALYSPVRHHAFVNYDDPDYVTANPHVLAGLTVAGVRWALTSTYGANWFPLTWISHMLDVELFGLDAGRHHLTSAVLHACSAVLLFLAFLRMTGARWRSAFVAAAFALHPLRVESVAWAAERKDVLCGLFWMLALLAYARYAERPGPKRYALVAAAFAGALLSKPMAVTLPAVLMLLDYWPLRRGPKLVEKLPLFAMSAAASVVTLLVQGSGGAVLTTAELSLGQRAANAVVSCAAYCLQTLWPSGLAVFYPFRVPAVWEALAALAGLAAVTAAVARRRELLAGWLWFLVTLLPVIGLVQVGLQSRADRYTYLPSIGLAILLAWAVPRQLLGAACLAWAAVTWTYLPAWRNSRTLFEHALAVTRNNYIAHNNFGVALRDAGDSAAAMSHFQSAIEIRPAYSDAQNNLGEALLRAGRLDEAESHIRTALALRPDSPEAHINLGTVLSRRGRDADAAAAYRRAIELDPDTAGAPDAHYNLGRFYGLAGLSAEAVAEFQQVLRVRPNDVEAHYNLGTAYVALDRLGDAIDEFRLAIRLRPGYVNAHFNLGAAFATRGDYAAAIGEFSETLRLQPEFEEARRNLNVCRELASRSGPSSGPR